MLERARADPPALSFVELDAMGDLSAHEGCYDLVFSNACLHWVPDHPTLIPRLLRLLAPGGQLAVQMPLANRLVMYREVVWPLVASERWRAQLDVMDSFHVLEPDAYVDLLEAHAASFDLWETTYYHLLPSHEAVLEWYRGSGLRPYLQALSAEDAQAFEADVLARIREAFPPRAAGGVTLLFPRLFLVAQR
jgi:trans-aconitate 2-methyltransferase